MNFILYSFENATLVNEKKIINIKKILVTIIKILYMLEATGFEPATP